jgi:hypothetical protein
MGNVLAAAVAGFTCYGKRVTQMCESGVSLSNIYVAIGDAETCNSLEPPVPSTARGLQRFPVVRRGGVEPLEGPVGIRQTHQRISFGTSVAPRPLHIESALGVSEC